MNEYFSVSNLEMTRIWHCFGNYMHKVDVLTAVNMLKASQANVIPINTHLLDEKRDLNNLQIGFAGAKLAQISQYLRIDNYILMLNINHQTTAQKAVEKTLWAYEITGEKVIKLEVLNDDLATSNDAGLIDATKRLRALNPDLILMPLLSNSYKTAKELVAHGCPLLRVMGSAIGSGKGIEDIEEFRKICSLGVPVVLDGGVSTSRDYDLARELGAEGCLINSALFTNSSDPVAYLKNFRMECYKESLPGSR